MANRSNARGIPTSAALALFGALVCWLSHAPTALAQRVQPGAPAVLAQNGIPPASLPPSLPMSTTVPSYGAPAYGAPAATLGAPAGAFDPYGPGYGAGGVAYPTPPPIGTTVPSTTIPSNSIFGNPGAFQPPPGAAQPSPFGGIGTGTFVDPAFPTNPPVLYPTPWGGTDGAIGWGPGGMFPYPAEGPYLKVFQDARVTYEHLAGGSAGADVGIDNIEVATTMNFPQFLGSTQPLQITPGFIMMFFDGPQPPVVLQDLPPRAYAAYLDAGWQSDPNRQVGIDLNFRLGVYSDFNTVTTESIRKMGTGTGWIRISPNLTLIGGATYLDRVDIKMLPVMGVIWRPNQFTNLELVFPYPRLSVYAATIGNTDVWWTAGAEYGGTSLTIERAFGGSDRIDYNDYRIFGGIQWYNRATTLKGFVEAGYAFERELIYHLSPDLEVNATYMIRAGIAY